MYPDYVLKLFTAKGWDYKTTDVPVRLQGGFKMMWLTADELGIKPC